MESISQGCSPCACGIVEACAGYGIEKQYLIAGIALGVIAILGILYAILHFRKAKKFKAFRWPLLAGILIAGIISSFAVVNIIQARQGMKAFQDQARQCSTTPVHSGGTVCEY